MWISLLKERDVLFIGCRWSIGDGIKINFIMDPWLKDVGKGGLYTSQDQHVYNITLNDLIVPNVKQWDIKRNIKKMISFVRGCEGGLFGVEKRESW